MGTAVWLTFCSTSLHTTILFVVNACGILHMLIMLHSQEHKKFIENFKFQVSSLQRPNAPMKQR